MFVGVVNIKFSSKIEADAMNALAKHELINVLPGILSIEVVRITDLHSIVCPVSYTHLTLPTSTLV